MSALLLVLLAQPLTAQPVRQGRGIDGGLTWGVSLGSATVTTAPTVYGTTAFGQARVAEPHTLADLTMTTGFDRDIWGVSVDGGGSVTWLSNEAAVLLRVVDGGVATIRTHPRFRYQAGKGQLVLQTSVCQYGQCRTGYYDDDDGLLFEANDGGLSYIRRSSTDGGVHETAWVLDAGPGFNAALGHILESRFQWLGVGSISAFVDGRHVLQVDHAGTQPGVYMSTATLPLTFEVRAPVNGNASMKAICSSVQSEGGSDPAAASMEVSRPSDISVSALSTDIPILSLRPAYSYNSIDNHVQVVPTSIWCASDNRRLRIRFVLNPSSMTGAVFTRASSNSAVEFDYSATAIDGGTNIGSMAVAAGQVFEQEVSHMFGELTRKLVKRAFPLAAVLDGGFDPSLDTLVVIGNGAGGGTTSVNCGVEFKEVR